ncbi:hypothetical protein [Dyella ginsengisoli]|nr:hypothetical protein [Dyella ginsengisoli]
MPDRVVRVLRGRYLSGKGRAALGQPAAMLRTCEVRAFFAQAPAPAQTG